ncbi:XrtA/PEP-CTERM system TPR-repeat protein PrsT [Pseudoduganella sp. UC29_106]|uniref:XrtA/PEP-CTERM system TPR-repeat protein PrsT n=1 Tax=Pseudoduganella sp. UC29_106 TaxID=3374553 RepID=UPI003756594E
MAHRSKSLALAAVLAVSSAMLLGGCKSETPESLMAEAKAFQQKGDKKAAQIQLKNLLAQTPDNAEARFLLAKLAYELGNLAAAEKEVRRAIELEYNLEDSRMLLAQVMMGQGEFQKVLDETEFSKRTPALLALRGEALLALKQTGKARQEFNDALAASPDSAAALTGLARLSAIDKDFDAARDFADQAIAKDATSVAAWTFKGELLRNQRKPEEARAAFQEVIKLDPTNRNANLESAYLDIVAGKYEQAQAAINAANKGSPKNFTVRYMQAVLDFSRGNYKTAHENLQAVQKVAPDHLPSVLLLGATEYHLGNLKQAQLSLRKYLDSQPENLYARKLLVGTLLRTGEPAEAMATLGPVLKGKVSDAALLELAAEASMQMRQPDKAAGYLEEAVAQVPDRAALHMALGSARLAMGDRTHALSELERAVALDSKSLPPIAALVRTQLELGNADQALATLSRVEQQFAKVPQFHLLRGLALLEKKDNAGARASYLKAVELAPTNFAAVGSLARLEVLEKKPEAARQHLQNLLQKDPKSVEVMTALALLADQSGQRDDAKRWLESAVAAQPDAMAPALRLGAYYLRTNEAAKTVELMRKMQVENASNTALLDLLTRALVLTGDTSGALEAASKLVGLAPKSALAQLRLAGVHLALKNENAASEDLKKAVALAPNYIPTYLTQIDLALNKGQVDKALEIARGLQKSHPKSYAGFLAEGDIMMMQKKPAQAVPPYEKSLDVVKTPQMLIKLTTALRLAGKAGEADQRVAQWRKTQPDDPLTGMYVAEQSITARQYKQAAEQLEGVLKKAPNNPAALNNLAWVYQQEKDARAIPTAEQAYKLSGDNPQVMDTLGFILIEQGKLERGLGLLRKASGLAPQAGDIRYHLAVGLHKAGDKAGARKELETALSGAQFAQADDARSLLKELQ